MRGLEGFDEHGMELGSDPEGVHPRLTEPDGADETLSLDDAPQQGGGIVAGAGEYVI